MISSLTLMTVLATFLLLDKTPYQRSSWKGGFNGADSHRRTRSTMKEKRSSQVQARQQEQASEITSLNASVKQRANRSRTSLHAFKACPSGSFFQQDYTILASPNSPTFWEPDSQTPEPMRDVSHSNLKNDP